MSIALGGHIHLDGAFHQPAMKLLIFSCCLKLFYKKLDTFQFRDLYYHKAGMLGKFNHQRFGIDRFHAAHVTVAQGVLTVSYLRSVNVTFLEP